MTVATSAHRVPLRSVAEATGPLVAAFGTALVSGWIPVWFLVNYLRRRSLMPFVIYRLPLIERAIRQHREGVIGARRGGAGADGTLGRFV